MKTKNILFIIAAVFVLGIIAMLTGCNGCSKPKYIPPTAIEVIEQKHNPVIDSLKQVTAVLTDSVSKLNKQLNEQKLKTSIAGAKAEQSLNRLRIALNEKDTVEVLVYADDVAEEFVVFKEEVAKQDSIQDRIIYMQGVVIENNRGEIELHESKFKELKRAYNVQGLQLSDYARQNERLQKKLKRAKFWGKVGAIGTAAGALLAGIVFL